MKKLYEFVVPITKTVEKPIEKELDGKKVTVLEKIEEQENKTYFIKRPSRSEYEEAELFHDIRFGHDVRSGVLTKSEIIKRFSNENVEIKRAYEAYTSKENELQRLLLLEKTDANIARKEAIQQELLNLLIEIQNFELTKSSVFEHTAENRARNKTIFWWILNLAYKLDEDKELALFEGETFDAKASYYDKLLETGTDYVKEVIQRFFYLIPAWYTGDLNKPEDFKKAEDILKSEIVKNKEAQARQEKLDKEEEQKISNEISASPAESSQDKKT